MLYFIASDKMLFDERFGSKYELLVAPRFGSKYVLPDAPNFPMTMLLRFLCKSSLVGVKCFILMHDGKVSAPMDPLIFPPSLDHSMSLNILSHSRDLLAFKQAPIFNSLIYRYKDEK